MNLFLELYKLNDPLQSVYYKNFENYDKNRLESLRTYSGSNSFLIFLLQHIFIFFVGMLFLAILILISSKIRLITTDSSFIIILHLVPIIIGLYTIFKLRWKIPLYEQRLFDKFKFKPYIYVNRSLFKIGDVSYLWSQTVFDKNDFYTNHIKPVKGGKLLSSTFLVEAEAYPKDLKFMFQGENKTIKFDSASHYTILIKGILYFYFYSKLNYKFY